jgi:hypothetical protein
VKPTFADNMTFFEALQRTRACLLALSMHQVIAQRVRIIGTAPIVIEIDRPLEVLGHDVTVNSGYAAITFGGCTVAWKAQQE